MWIQPERKRKQRDLTILVYWLKKSNVTIKLNTPTLSGQFPNPESKIVKNSPVPTSILSTSSSSSSLKRKRETAEERETMSNFHGQIRALSSLLKHLKHRMSSSCSGNPLIMSPTRSFTTTEGHRPTIVHKRSLDILHDPWFNKVNLAPLPKKILLFFFCFWFSLFLAERIAILFCDLEFVVVEEIVIFAFFFFFAFSFFLIWFRN